MTVRVVYFSSVTEMTKRFVEKVGFESERIPLRRNDAQLDINYDYVLIVPTYGGGTHSGAVPKQVIKFLNIENNRNHCLGVIASGNTNFGEAYLLAGKVISHKLQIPFIYGFELMGTPDDVDSVRTGLKENWDRLLNERKGEEHGVSN